MVELEGLVATLVRKEDYGLIVALMRCRYSMQGKRKVVAFGALFTSRIGGLIVLREN